MNLFTKQNQSHRYRKQIYGYKMGSKVKGSDKLSVRLTYHVHIDIYKIDSQQGPIYGKGTKHFQYLIIYNVNKFEKEYIHMYN